MTTVQSDPAIDALERDYAADAARTDAPTAEAPGDPVRPPRRGWSIAGSIVTALGGLLVALVVFELLVTPIVHERDQQALAGEFRERLEVAAALSQGIAPAGASQFEAVDLGGEGLPIPELKGELAATAIERLETEGHTVRVTTEPSREWIPGAIVRTVPEGGTAAAPDSEVTVVVATLEAGTPVAAIAIPNAGVDEIVVEGTAATEMASGPGHYRGSPLPGEAGNAVIAGHRTLYGGPFHDLDLLTEGDEITVTTLSGVSQYRVRDTKVIGEGAPDVFERSDDNRLTLVTSDPAYSSSERLVVVADLQGQPVTRPKDEATAKALVIAPDELGRAGDATAWGPLLLALELLLAALVVAALLYRRWRRWTVWLLTTPIILATAFLFFESLTRLFPSTV